MLNRMILLAAFSVATFTTYAQGERTLSIATDGYYPPYSILNDDGKLTGYDIDVGEEVCKRAKLNCEFKLQDFPTIVQSVRFKKHDLVMAGMNDNDLRRQVVDFSMPYAFTPGRFVVKSNSPLTNFCSACGENIEVPRGDGSTPALNQALLSTFVGKTIGVEKNSSYHKFFTENAELRGKFKFKFGKMEELFAEVKLGRIDATLIPMSFSEGQFKKDAQTGMTYAGPKLSGGYFGNGVAIICRKNDRALKQTLDNVLADMKRDGTLKALSQKWFERDVTSK